MTGAADGWLAHTGARLPAALYQLCRSGQGVESFPFVSEQITTLVHLTPPQLRESSAPLWALLSRDDAVGVAESLRHSAQQLTPWYAEFPIRLPDGPVKWIAAAATPGREADGGTVWHGLFLDVTERHIAEQRLRQAQKMDAVGRLAGGVAHDLNNVVTAIMGNGDMALAELPLDHPVRWYIEHSRQAAERAAALTRQLLAFGRRQVLRLETIRWQEIVAQAHQQLIATADGDSSMELCFEPEVPAVRADREQLEQVLVNLVANAYDAMPAGGRLTIAAGRRTISEAEARPHPGLRAGDYAWLQVKDTGVGIDQQMQPLIFEPFFTTKMTASRPGLGLSTVYGIVKQLDGYVQVESALGAGATFTVYLPTVAAPNDPPAETPADARPGQHSGTVLIAEDEASVREPVRRVLERFGYRVLDAPDANAALALAQNSDERIDLLLTDIVMPGMGGSELAERVRQLRPKIRVLFMSGYSNEAVATHGILAPGTAFLQKPFSVTELVECVRETLRGASS